MSVSVTMPRLGESVTEGTITRWLKNEGDQVEADEPLLEVSTDKVDTEVPSPASGVLTSIKVQEDETVEIGVELAVIGDGSAAEADSAGADSAGADSAGADSAGADSAGADSAGADSAGAEAGGGDGASGTAEASGPSAESTAESHQSTESPARAPEQPSAATPPDPSPSAAPQAVQEPGAQSEPQFSADARQSSPADDEDVAGAYVTPLVRKLASEHGIDLNTVQGTGVGGRIRKSDVLSAADRAPTNGAGAVASVTPPAAATTAQAPPPPAAPAAAAPAPAPPAAAAATTGEPPARGRVEKLSRRRQLIAARMVESLQVAAQLTTVVEVDVTRIARLRDRARADFQTREGVKLSFLPFFAVAAVEALKVHPVLNASIDTDEGTITFHGAEHLGIAVDTEAGLTVPVIHDAGDLNLGGIARKIADLAERTRTNKITPDELGGGTFTLTNTGSRGALFDTPIINQPQVAILGTGVVVKRPVVVSDDNLGETIAVRSMVYLALSYDHRIVDGADAARFLATVKERLEAGRFERALGLS